MSEEPEFFTYTREEFLDEFVHPDDRPTVEEARHPRRLHSRARRGAEGDRRLRRLLAPRSLTRTAFIKQMPPLAHARRCMGNGRDRQRIR